MKLDYLISPLGAPSVLKAGTRLSVALGSAVLAAVMACVAVPAVAAGDRWQQLDEEQLALRRAGHVEEAVAVLERMLALAEDEFGPGHRHVVESLVELGWIRLAQDRADDAGRLIERAVGIARRTLAADDALLGRVYELSGDWHEQAGRNEEALADYTRALANRRAEKPPNRRVEGRLLTAIGNVQAASGDNAGAETSYRKAIETIEAALRGVTTEDQLYEGRFRLSHAYHSLAAIHHGAGKDAEAEQAVTHALSHDEALYGDRSSEFMRSLEWRATLRMRLGRREDARADYKRVAAWYAAEEPKSEDAAIALTQLAALGFLAGDLPAAIGAWTRVVDLRSAVFGESSASVQTGLRELSALQTIARSTDAATQSLARADALARSAGPGAVEPAGRSQRFLLTSLGELVEMAMPDDLGAGVRGSGCDQARLWLHVARLRTAGADPRAKYAYVNAMDALPGGPYTSAGIALVDEYVAFLERSGDTSVETWRRQAALSRQAPTRTDVPACQL